MQANRRAERKTNGKPAAKEGPGTELQDEDQVDGVVTPPPPGPASLMTSGWGYSVPGRGRPRHMPENRTFVGLAPDSHRREQVLKPF